MTEAIKIEVEVRSNGPTRDWRTFEFPDGRVEMFWLDKYLMIRRGNVDTKFPLENVLEVRETFTRTNQVVNDKSL